jgi:hypothetical protein
LGSSFSRSENHSKLDPFAPSRHAKPNVNHA